MAMSAFTVRLFLGLRRKRLTVCSCKLSYGITFSTPCLLFLSMNQIIGKWCGIQSRWKCEEELKNIYIWRRYIYLSSTIGRGNAYILFWLFVYSRTIFIMTIGLRFLALWLLFRIYSSININRTIFL